MNITIIGTGNMARGIATRLLAGGNTVTISGKTVEDAEALANELRGTNANASLKTARSGEPIADEVVVLAVWFTDAVDFVRQQRDQFAGKTIIEISNPLNESFDGLATPPGTSVTEEVAKAAPADAHVIKAFNTTFAGTLVAEQVAGQKLDVFIAGDNTQAKSVVSQLVAAGGMRSVDVGSLSRAQQLEGLSLLNIIAQSVLGTNFGSALKIIS